jgi:hypothetical protein
LKPHTLGAAYGIVDVVIVVIAAGGDIENGFGWGLLDGPPTFARCSVIILIAKPAKRGGDDVLDSAEKRRVVTN